MVRTWPALEAERRKAVEAAQARASAAADRLREDGDRVEAARALREANLAAALAARLADGVPCPVCGSADHPHPAQGDLDPAALAAEPPRPDEARAEADRRARADLAQAASRLEEDALRHGQSLARLREGGWPHVAAYDAARTELDARTREGNARLQETADLLAGRDPLRTGLKAAQEALEGARGSLDGARQAETAAKETCRGLERSLGLAIDDPEQAWREASRAHKAREARIQEEERSLADLGARREKADAAQATLARLLEVRREHLAQAGTALAVALAALERALAGCGFASVTDQRAALREPGRLQELEALLRKAADDRTVRLARLEALDAALDGMARPDLEALEGAREDAAEAFTRAGSAAQSARNALEAFRARRARVQDLQDKLAAATEASADLLQLSAELDGTNRRRMKFSSWALAWWLQRVLEHASRQLDLLSGGRYRFRLRTDVDDKRRSAGLEIDVHDAYANGLRSVRTLSGGEKFLASLSLALGLAEVIQGRSGGIELDALFIDEGFGSLDDETLEKAMRVLDKLGQGRMVGLISHVEAMKQAIDCQVRVRKQDGGSRVELVRVSR